MKNPCDLVVSVTLIGCQIAQYYTTEELSVLADIFSLLGETLETISDKRQLIEADLERLESIIEKKTLKELKEKIDVLYDVYLSSN